MATNDELKKIDMKNYVCYYFDDIMIVGKFDFGNFLLDKQSYENSYENILVYGISSKTFVGAKLLRIRFVKVDGFTKIYDGNRYLELFGPKRYGAIYDGIIYPVIEKSGITYSANHYSARIRIDSNNSLRIEKTLTFHNVIILFKSVFSSNENNYSSNMFVEKGSNEGKYYTQFV